MKIAVLNAGSSSLKFQLFTLPQERSLVHAMVEQIGEESGHLLFEYEGKTIELREEIACHYEALVAINRLLVEYAGVNFKELDAIAHRVVHGGEHFTTPTFVDANVIEKIEELIPLAPLHNRANLEGILVSRKKAPKVVQIAVFDTAFHTTMPKEAFVYALDYGMYKEHAIRRYGFHGSSHSYLLKESAKLLHKDAMACNLITLHLGNGASACAIKEGKSIDTSMGFTPLEGLVMGSRCGDIDPEIVLYMQRTLGMSLEEVDAALNKKAGLLGVCGHKDVRDILEDTSEQSELALNIMVRRIQKYIGAYFALLGKVDALVFSGGIGEHAIEVRKRVLETLAPFGVALDVDANEANRELITKESSPVKAFVIATNEELEIARQSYILLQNKAL